MSEENEIIKQSFESLYASILKKKLTNVTLSNGARIPIYEQDLYDIECLLVKTSYELRELLLGRSSKQLIHNKTLEIFIIWIGVIRKFTKSTRIIGLSADNEDGFLRNLFVKMKCKHVVNKNIEIVDSGEYIRIITPTLKKYRETDLDVERGHEVIESALKAVKSIELVLKENKITGPGQFLIGEYALHFIK